MILVTGGLGFIGAATVRALAAAGQRCVALTRGQVPDPSPFADLGDAVTIARGGPAGHEGVTGVVHLATPEFGPDGVRRTVDGLLDVLALGAGRVAVASSLGVYEGVPEVPHREDARLPVPANPVPAVMLAKELVGALAGDVVSLRIATVWGPGNRWHDATVNTLVRAAARGGQPDRPVHADDGTDLCHVSDCARAIALLMTAGTLHHRTYNVGAGHPTTPADVAAALGADLGLRPGRDPAGPGHDTWLDITRLREDTGYEPTADLAARLREYVDHLRAGHDR